MRSGGWHEDCANAWARRARDGRWSTTHGVVRSARSNAQAVVKCWSRCCSTWSSTTGGADVAGRRHGREEVARVRSEHGGARKRRAGRAGKARHTRESRQRVDGGSEATAAEAGGADETTFLKRLTGKSERRWRTCGGDGGGRRGCGLPRTQGRSRRAIAEAAAGARRRRRGTSGLRIAAYPRPNPPVGHRSQKHTHAAAN